MLLSHTHTLNRSSFVSLSLYLIAFLFLFFFIWLLSSSSLPLYFWSKRIHFLPSSATVILCVTLAWILEIARSECCSLNTVHITVQYSTVHVAPSLWKSIHSHPLIHLPCHRAKSVEFFTRFPNVMRCIQISCLLFPFFFEKRRKKPCYSWQDNNSTHHC